MTDMRPWLEAGVAEGLKLVKQLHDKLPPDVQKITGQIPGEFLIASIIIILLFNIVIFLTNVKVGSRRVISGRRTRMVSRRRETEITRAHSRSCVRAASLLPGCL